MIRLDLRGVDAVRKMIASAPEAGEKALLFAVNEAAQFGAAESSRKVRAQLNLSQSYMGSTSSKNGKIHLEQKASASSREAVITVQDKPVSLGRYAQGTPKFGRPKAGKKNPAPKVKVFAGGGATRVGGGFFVKLPQGNKDTDGGFNLGVAVRLKDGVSINKNVLPGKQFRPGVYLLYGPDVPQAMTSISEEVLKPIGDRAEAEFFRQFARLLG